jgi:hypothetical protein
MAPQNKEGQELKKTYHRTLLKPLSEHTNNSWHGVVLLLEFKDYL